MANCHSRGDWQFEQSVAMIGLVWLWVATRTPAPVVVLMEIILPSVVKPYRVPFSRSRAYTLKPIAPTSVV